MIVKKKSKAEWKCEVVETDQLSDPAFDLEAWLADLLVEYWLASTPDEEEEETERAG